MVQTNLGDIATPAAIKSACERNGFLFQSVEIIPFSDTVPNIEYKGPVIAYGSARFIKNVVASRKWIPGAFFDEVAFTVANCLRAWKKWMVNSDSIIVRLDAVAALPYARDDELFVRPNSDFKEFAGAVMSFGALRDWSASIVGQGFEIDGSLLIAVASPKPIRSEWRIFATEGPNIIAATRYRFNGHLAPQAGAPQEVLAFVETRLREWMPSPALALDVAEVNGGLRILELTDLHSAGHYMADLEAVAIEVSKVAARHWAGNR
jgi:hypothetical protein